MSVYLTHSQAHRLMLGEKVRAKPRQLEYPECVEFADWLRKRGIFFTHFPAGELRFQVERVHKSGRLIRYSPTGVKLKRMGMLEGVSDYLIFDRPPNFPNAVGVCFEMKALKGDPPTGKQFEFLGAMMARGWVTGWGRGASEAIMFMQELGWK